MMKTVNDLQFNKPITINIYISEDKKSKKENEAIKLYLVNFVIDTGSSFSFIPYTIINKLGYKFGSENDRKNFILADGNCINLIEFTVPVIKILDCEIFDQKIYSNINSKGTALLGMNIIPYIDFSMILEKNISSFKCSINDYTYVKYQKSKYPTI